MYAVEFHTTIKDGRIEVPREFQGEFQHAVRVILLRPDSASAQSTIIDRLLAQPLALKEFSPLTRDEIYER